MSVNRFTSLRSRLLLLVIFAVVPALGLSLYTGLEQRRLAGIAAEEAALRVARLAAANQERLVEGARQLLITLAHLPEIQWGDSEECNAFLAKLLEEHRAYANFGVADEKGMIFASAIPIEQPVFAGDHSWFRRVMQTKDFAAGDYQIGQITKTATLNFAYPIFEKKRRVDRVVYAALDISWVNNLAAEAKLPADAAITFIDPHGMILARHPDAEKLIGKSLPDTPLLREILARGKEGTAKLPGFDGMMRLNAFTPLHGASGNVGAYINIGIPVRVAFADAHRLLIRNFVLLGTVFALSIAAAWILGNVFLFARVKELLRATTQLTSGDLRARSGLDYSEGELGQLARAFDEMAETLELRSDQRQHADEALRESERRFHDLFEFSPDAVFVEDTAGNILDVNAAGCSLIGLTHEQLIGKNATELVPESIRSGLIDRLPEWGAGKIKALVSENLRADGTTVPVELRASCIEYAGRPALLFHVRDITERKRAEEALRHAHDDLEQRVDDRTAALAMVNRALVAEVSDRTRAEERLKEHAETVSDLYNNAPCGYHSIDKDGVFVRINDTELSWLGYTRDEIVGQKKFGEFLTPESLKLHRESFPKFKEQGSVHDIEYEMVRKNGTIMPVLLNATAVKDAAGNFVMSRSTVFDITERRLAEQQLDRFFTLSLNLLCIADFAGFFKRLNPAWEKTLGYTDEELRARPYIEFIHPDDRAATLAQAEKVAGGEPVLSFENRYLCKNGGYRWLLWQAAPSLSEQLIYAVALDITARKQGEDQTRELQNFLTSIVENIPLMLFVKDAQNLRFVRVNKEEEQLLGLPRS
jgi:PAS domain S-box-containing protein